MSGHVRERHLVVPALFAAAESPGGHILTTELIGVLETEFQPHGEDAEILPELDDTRFAQKVHNPADPPRPLRGGDGVNFQAL